MEQEKNNNEKISKNSKELEKIRKIKQTKKLRKLRELRNKYTCADCLWEGGCGFNSGSDGDVCMGFRSADGYIEEKRMEYRREWFDEYDDEDEEYGDLWQ